MPPRGPLQLTLDEARRFLELLECATATPDVASKLKLAISDANASRAEHVTVVIKVCGG